MSAGATRLRAHVEGAEDTDSTDLNVEIWGDQFPDDVLPVDVPLSTLDGLPAEAASYIRHAHLGTAVPDENGNFELDISDATIPEGADAVFVRVFDGEDYVDSAVEGFTVEATAGGAVLAVTIDQVDLSAGRSTLAVGGAAVGMLVLGLAAGAVLLSGNESETADPTLQPDQPDWQPQIAAPSNPFDPPRTLSQQAQFLYTGDDPIQAGVSEETIEPTQAAVLRGRVTDRSGSPVDGVTVTVQNHPEYGETTTRATGLFDMVVNGGGTVVANFESTDYLPVQRKLPARQTNYEALPEIALVPKDSSPSQVAMNATETQIARASTSNDGDGQRRPTIVVPPRTVAQTPDGSMPEQLTIRATEYTVGDNGPEAMPRRLPPETAYTFALELSADEAEPSTQQAGSTAAADGDLQRAFMGDAGGSVQFSQPVILYVENFLDFPVGEAVPTGAVDRSDASWSAVDDGRVVEVLGTSGGQARLDVDGSGTAASSTARQELGISNAELSGIAGIYSGGTQLWRVPIPHFTPFDCNWPREEPDDARPPARPIPRDWVQPAEDNQCPSPGRGVGGSVSGGGQ